MADQSAEDHPLDQLRLTLMQDVLPVGLAMADRVRQGGAAKVVEAFNGNVEGSLDALRQEGEPAARSLRDQLDQVSPGLGNPVMPVTVSVDGPEPEPSADETVALLETLERIEGRLDQLRAHLTINPSG